MRTAICHLPTRARNFDAYTHDLPSASRKPPQPAATLAEDAMYFNGILTGLCDAGKDVVVLGHSYGGSVLTESVRNLTEKAEGRGRVVGMIYMTALVPKVGQVIGSITAHLDMDVSIKPGVCMTGNEIERSILN